MTAVMMPTKVRGWITVGCLRGRSGSVGLLGERVRVDIAMLVQVSVEIALKTGTQVERTILVDSPAVTIESGSDMSEHGAYFMLVDKVVEFMVVKFEKENARQVVKGMCRSAIFSTEDYV
jgi:predicted adenine nucleotide alpha hydrolase (AANH) superfamily ATPase